MEDDGDLALAFDCARLSATRGRDVEEELHLTRLGGHQLPNFDTNIDREPGEQGEGLERLEGKRDGEFGQLREKSCKTRVFAALRNWERRELHPET